MAKLARISNGIVENVIVGEPSEFSDLVDVTDKKAGPGHIDNGDGTFSPPEPPTPSWGSLEFLRRFTRDERIAVRTAAKNDPVVEDMLSLIDKSDSIKANDPDVVQGMQYLVDQGHITASRRNAILAAS